jgi:hypothetical protein
MPKITYILALAMLYSTLSYGQQITFYKNSNYQADILHQSLNKEGDRLVLVSKSVQIIKVEIFNENYSELIEIDSTKAEINLKALPLGNFVIQAKLDQKWIVMYLEKKEDLIITSSKLKKKNNSVKIASSHPKLNLRDDQSVTSIQKPFKTIKEDDSFFYWVVSESNSSFGSSKTMRLEYKEDVEKLISKAKLELKTAIGKNNKLIVYEIYDRSKFMTKQLRNTEYYKSETSTVFNVVPVYAFMN